MPGPSAFLDIQIVGQVQDVQAMLHRLDTSLNPTAIAAFLGAEVDPYIRERARQRFANEGDDVVGQWAPLADATNAFRTAQGFPAAHPINKRTGELEAYIVSAPNQITISTFGTTLVSPRPTSNKWLQEKLRTAQMGKDRPRTPARPVLGLNEKDLLAVTTKLAFYIQRGRPL